MCSVGLARVSFLPQKEVRQYLRNSRQLASVVRQPDAAAVVVGISVQLHWAMAGDRGVQRACVVRRQFQRRRPADACRRTRRRVDAPPVSPAGFFGLRSLRRVRRSGVARALARLCLCCFPPRISLPGPLRRV